ncbi:MAG: L-serine ammonia-lyase, iron-sulfur-dependent subunit beta [Syntrophaceticus sp.]
MAARSVFEIIGPVMIGPSSSHTAGAVRIGRFARIVLVDKPIKARVNLYGSFAKTSYGHGTERAILAGLLGMLPADERIKEAEDIAERDGLQYEFIHSAAPKKHPNTAGMYLTGAKGKKVYVEGCSIGGGEIVISRIDQYELEIRGKKPTLMVEHENRPGMIGSITALLGDQNINISSLYLYGSSVNRDYNLLVVECDEIVPEEVRQRLSNMPEVTKTSWINPWKGEI